MNILKIFEKKPDYLADTIAECLVNVDNQVATLFGPPKPKDKDMLEYWMPVVGVTHDGRQEVIRNLHGDEDISLVEEKYGDHEDAVAVFADDMKIGYLPDNSSYDRGYAVRISRMIKDKIRKGKFHGVIGFKIVGGTDDKPNYGVRIRIRNNI